MKRILAALVVLAVMMCATGLAACSAAEPEPDTSELTAVVKQYYAALNQGDLDGMLECCDSTTKNTLNGSIELLQGILSLSGSSNIDVRALVASLYPAVGESMSRANVAVSIEPTQMEASFDDDAHATVRDMLTITVSSGDEAQDIEQAEEFSLVREGEEWKIDLSEQTQNAISSAFDIVGAMF